MESKIDKAFKAWKQRMKDNHINAICKPCWELNYCPYGPLVENFPLTDNEDYRCRIFGHECPVYFVAEPFTETKKRRNISRNIPMEIKLRVFKRDNQICQRCGKNVGFDEINFDHIIPWSKGGPSDESNIRMLCEKCNKERGNDFEDEQLVVFKEVFNDPSELNLSMLEDLLRLVLLWSYIQNRSGKPPTEESFCRIIHGDDIDTDKFMYFLVSQIIELLTNDTPFISIKKKMNALRFRWGIEDGKSHSIKETCKRYRLDFSYYVEVEMLLLRRVGYILKKGLQCSNKYYELKVDSIHFEKHLEVENNVT